MDKAPQMTDEDFVYSRIGMALVSAQRVEFITGQVLEHLAEFDKDVYRITTEEFMRQSQKSSNAYKTLGAIFKLLKLNPKLMIEDELNSYLKKRNEFVHKFWVTYLKDDSIEIKRTAIDFCYDFGRHSDRIFRFFNGFLYFLALRHVKDGISMHPDVATLANDFEYFMISLKEKELR